MILTDTGHIDFAISMMANTFWLGWGTLPAGSEWDVPPPVDVTKTDLESEVGRTKELIKEYVVQDPNGTIKVGNQLWSISTVPTKYIYVKFEFAQEDNAADSIYQLGIFTNTVPSAGNEDKTYLLPTEITEKGNLVFLENIEKINRNDVTSEAFSFVITL